MVSEAQQVNKRKHVTTACMPCRESKVKVRLRLGISDLTHLAHDMYV